MSESLRIHPASQPDDAPIEATPSAGTPVPPIALPQFVDSAEIAAALKIGERTFRRLIAIGKTPAPIRIGGSVRFDRAEIVAWLGYRTAAGNLADRIEWSALWNPESQSLRRNGANKKRRPS